MPSTLERLRGEFGPRLANLTRGKSHRWIQGALVIATIVVLFVPIRPGARPLISFGSHPAANPPVQRLAAHVAQHPVVPPIPRALEMGDEPASPDVHRLAQWVVDTANNGRMSFAILDKKNAKVFVFAPGGKLIEASPVLLGYAKGDDTVVGIGKRPIADVKPFERTTPAGRFMAEPGRNAGMEDVIWVDYDAAVSMHRVRLTNPAEHRAERLKSANAQARRISYGCINIPPAFFERVLWPNFQRKGGVVYIVPEVKQLEAVFPQVPQLPTAQQAQAQPQPSSKAHAA